ncbi:MAG: efflux RND transporter periplasmic adaptor subunit [Gemmatimonadota bacterium]
MVVRQMRTVAGLVVGLIVAGCGRSGDPPAATPAAGSSDRIVVDSAQRNRFKIETVEPVSFYPSIATTGTVAFSSNTSTQVLAPMSGPVTRILVAPGAHVVPGQALATVSSPDFAAAVGAYRKGQAMWENAQRIAQLNEQLFTNDALARRELDQSRTDLAGAVADRDAALLQLKALGVDDKTLAAIREGKATEPVEAAIRAPIGGTVVEKLITPGQLIQAGATPTFTIADLASLWVLANVFEGDIHGIKQGQHALVMTDVSADTLPGVVDYVAALVDPATKATSVRIVVPNRNQVLRRDMLVQVVIRSTSPRTGMLVPAAAVLRDDENLPYLFVAMADGSFARRRIELGSRVSASYEIASGLTSGERVVVDGALFLQASGQQ